MRENKVLLFSKLSAMMGDEQLREGKGEEWAKVFARSLEAMGMGMGMVIDMRGRAPRMSVLGLESRGRVVGAVC